MIPKPFITRLRLAGALTAGIALLGSFPLVANDYDKDSKSKSSARESVKMNSREFAQHVYLGGLKEVRLATIASERGERAEVREFAKMLQTDHTQANERLAEIAKRKGIELPAANTFAANNVATIQTAPGDLTPVPADAPRPTEPPRSDLLKDSTTEPRANRVNDASADSKSGFNKEKMVEKHSQTIREIEGKTGAEFDKAFVGQMIKDHAKNVSKFETASRELDDTELKEFTQNTLPTLRSHHSRAKELGHLLGIPVDYPEREVSLRQ